MPAQTSMENLFSYFPPKLAEALRQLSLQNQLALKEIRLHAASPVLLYFGNCTRLLQQNGQVAVQPNAQTVTLTQPELENVFQALCRYSVHSFEEEITHGFLTIEGGHRVGLFGTAVLENGRITAFKDYSSLNIRVAREVRGAADDFFETVLHHRLQSVLLIGAPATGKTTLLRDAVRGISGGRLGRFYKVAVVDERGELSAMHHGIPQNDLGPCTDIYHLCPKATGMEMAIRAGSPELLVCDEIGAEDDINLLLQSMFAGVRILATAHAGSLEELSRRGWFARLLEEQVFDKIVLLQNQGIPGVIQHIWNREEVSPCISSRPC